MSINDARISELEVAQSSLPSDKIETVQDNKNKQIEAKKISNNAIKLTRTGSNQSATVAANSPVKVQFNDMEYNNTGNLLTFDTANSRIIVGAGISKVEVSSQNNVQFPNISNGVTRTYVFRNGIRVPDIEFSNTNALPWGAVTNTIKDRTINVSEGDFIELFTLLNTAGAVNVSYRGDIMKVKVIE